MIKERQDEHRLIGIAHRHRRYHVDEHVFHVRMCDQLPVVLLCISRYGFGVEVFEAPVFADWHLQIRNELSFSDIAINGFTLQTDAASELDL